MGVSLLRGRLSPLQALELVASRVTDEGLAIARVRYTSAGVLRARGFLVEHTPTKVNPDHCSALWRREHEADFTAPWPNDVEETFRQCFNEEKEEEPQ